MFNKNHLNIDIIMITWKRNIKNSEKNKIKRYKDDSLTTFHL